MHMQRLPDYVIIMFAISLTISTFRGRTTPGLIGYHDGKAAALTASYDANGWPNLNGIHPLQVLRENTEELVIEFTLPTFSIDEGPMADGLCQVLRVEGAVETAKPGWPRLPTYSLLAGIPPEGTPVITILESSQTALNGRYSLCPAPRPIFEDQPDRPLAALGEEAIPDPQVYSLDQFEPSSLVELAQTGFVRNQRVAQLQVLPFQYNPATGELRVTTHLRARVGLQTAPSPLNLTSQRVDEGVFETTLQSSLVNYQTALTWRKPTQPPASPSSMSQISPASQMLKIEVKSEGMVQVTYSDMQAAGIMLSGVNPRTFQLTNRGSGVAIQVTGEEDGDFDPGDRILFYAAPVETVYTTTNIYWLRWGGAAGLRMSVQDGAPAGGSLAASYAATQHAQTNTRYLSTQPGPDGDKWYWGVIVASSQPASGAYTIQLRQIDFTSPYSATLRGVLRGAAAFPQHHTRISVNGHLVDDQFWPSVANYILEVNFPASYLQEGANTITVALPRDSGITSETVLVNWFEIDYRKRFVAEDEQIIFETEAQPGENLYQVEGFVSDQIEVFDITDPGSPLVVGGASVQAGEDGNTLGFQSRHTQARRFIALSADGFIHPTLSIKSTTPSLRDPSNGGDYLILTHPDFWTEVQPLADWRAGQGLRVRTINVQDIYDEFNNGIFDPRAIHDFLAYAYENWQPPAPLYVVLVGDGHYDPRNYLGTNEVNFIPAYLSEVDPWLIETPSDNRYVTIIGDDNLPDMAIGRLPVKTPAEAAAVVAKIVGYEQNPSPGDWNSGVLFVADNSDGAGNFAAYSDLVMNGYLPAGYTPTQAYYPGTYTTPASMQAAILDGFNQGMLLVNYVGHGSVNQWASENFFGTNDPPRLDNPGKLPVVAAMACLNGYFHQPSPSGADNSSLAEALVRASERGAIAAWSSAGMGLSSGQDYLDRGLFQAVFLNGETRLGMAILQSKLFLYGSSPYYPDLIDNFTLFGDPALKLNLRQTDVSIQYSTQPDQIIRSGEPVTYTLSYVNNSPVYAPTVTITESTPAGFAMLSSQASPTPLAPSNDLPQSWEVGGLLPGQSGTITVSGALNVEVFAYVTTAADIRSPAPEANINDNVAGPLTFLVVNPDGLITDLNAWSRPKAVEISWQTASEIITTSYNVYRSNPNGVNPVQLNAQPIPSQAPGEQGGATYTFLDTNPTSGKEDTYWVEIVHQLGTTIQATPVVSADFQIYLPLAVH